MKHHLKHVLNRLPGSGLVVQLVCLSDRGRALVRRHPTEPEDYPARAKLPAHPKWVIGHCEGGWPSHYTELGGHYYRTNAYFSTHSDPCYAAGLERWQRDDTPYHNPNSQSPSVHHCYWHPFHLFHTTVLEEAEAKLIEYRRDLEVLVMEETL